MLRRGPLVTVVLPLGLALAGCGGRGGPGTPGPPAPGAVFALGSVEVRTVSGAAPSMVTLPSPATSPIAFTVLHGARIVRLAEIGYGRVAFVSDRVPNSEIYLMNADGSGRQRLTTDPAKDFEPDWSPDGATIAFTSARHGANEICVMNADGSNYKRLTDNSASDQLADWSPDGRKIVFRTDRDTDHEIYVMNPDGSGQANLTDHDAIDVSAQPSPHRRRR